MSNEEANLEKIDKNIFFFEENWFSFVYTFAHVNRLCSGSADAECWENACALKAIVIYCTTFGYKWETLHTECLDYSVLHWW